MNENEDLRDDRFGTHLELPYKRETPKTIIDNEYLSDDRFGTLQIDCYCGI